MSATTAKLLEYAQQIADGYYDGHFALLKFTTHWKAVFGLDLLGLSSPEGYKALYELEGYDTADEALRAALGDIVDMGGRDHTVTGRILRVVEDDGEGPTNDCDS